MRSLLTAYSKTVAVLSALTVTIAIACNSIDAKKAESKDEPKLMTEKELAERGKYLVNTVGGCADCHSPKKFGPHGPEPDPDKFLSGHPANDPLPALNGAKPFTPGNWILFSPDLTTFVGPWGISYAANLTPHATGLGSWKLENFIGALRKGKHLGVDEGRPIMPPMPWPTIGQMTDEDLKAVYTYLRTIPPIENLVPAPVSPEEAQELFK